MKSFFVYKHLRVFLTLTTILRAAVGFGQLTPTFDKTFSNGGQTDMGRVAIDNAGNTYFMRSLGPVNKSYSQLTLTKFTPAGVMSQATPIYLPSVSEQGTGPVSVLVGRDQNIYVFAQYGNGSQGGWLAKYTPSLALAWTRSFSVPNYVYRILQVYESPSGVHVAIDVNQTSGSSPFVQYLELLVLTPDNSIASETINQDFSQPSGDYDETNQGVVFVATGVSADDKSDKWAPILESTGKSVGGETVPIVRSGTLNINYQFTFVSRHADPSGAYSFIFENAVVTQKYGSNSTAMESSFAMTSFVAGDYTQPHTAGPYHGLVTDPLNVAINQNGVAVKTQSLDGVNSTLYAFSEGGFGPFALIGHEDLPEGFQVRSSSSHFFLVKQLAQNQVSVEEHGTSVLSPAISTISYAGSFAIDVAANANRLAVSTTSITSNNIESSRVRGFSVGPTS
jgi:hypothetical protein